ncbi:MAG: hypothetical protein MUC38_08595 [Cyclobacteriaceae bacterium]|nr:hypothetical protein [Cyclobacteriaceae bacterium]
MMPKNDFCTGVLYSHDRWTNYWEGTLKRDNGNIGSVTTQVITWVGNYGITDKLNVIAMLPYVKTEASQGTMQGMDGLQDLTLGVKYQAVSAAVGSGTFRGFVTGMASTPLSNYTPDFLPLSIGLASTNVGGRLTGNYTWENGLYLNVSAGYTWRSNVTLDRPSYFTDGRIYFTNEVQMPNVFDYNADLGYLRNGLQLVVTYQQQNVLGGGDIRRQDMPFVSNRMNFSRVGALVMYYLPFHKNLAVRAMVNQTVAGRNVGESTTLLGGFLYTLHFGAKETKTE